MLGGACDGGWKPVAGVVLAGLLSKVRVECALGPRDETLNYHPLVQRHPTKAGVNEGGF